MSFIFVKSQQQQIFEKLQLIVDLGLDKIVKVPKKFQDFKFEIKMVTGGIQISFRFDHVYFHYKHFIGDDFFLFEESYSQASGRQCKSYREGQKGLAKAEAFIEEVAKKIQKSERSESFQIQKAIEELV